MVSNTFLPMLETQGHGGHEVVLYKTVRFKSVVIVQCFEKHLVLYNLGSDANL